MCLFTACSAGYGAYGTHPAHQNSIDFIFNEAHTIIRTGRIDPNLGNRSLDSGFIIMRSEYWRRRSEQEIFERERERLEKLERERFYYY